MAVSVMVPRSVNFAELESRFNITCRTLVTSVLSAPSAPLLSTTRRLSFFFISGSATATTPADQCGDVEPLGEDLHASRLDLGEVEHVVDQSEQVPAAHVDLLEVLGERRFAQLRGLLLEHLAVADDGVERRAQLVRHVGEEARLLPSRLGERDVRVLEPRQRKRQLAGGQR